MRTTRAATLPVLAGALTIGAGLVHAAAAGTHEGDRAVVLLLATAAVLQVVAGAAVAARPGPLPLVALAVLDLGLAAVWVASRTTGLPLVAGWPSPRPSGCRI